ncbi:hypothetical protein BDV38DRAFT_279043 [Aspergillus pseudotamarii]|uniref:NAD(P)-binding domain-containing protein n=1 Tax=Aspergillus pseudotamarii TaxID=132259 RepID=A0A5N6T5U7_ASPPS|nr:uncharacterized protein BDV38DRAFT_279043 [Aspergillus pseudotamarii]KAE8141694.1 hypothetical protein BDV38DRAFT_279043 [Aspergillus pseudotamarii]
MHFLVLGATGAIGSQFCALALNKGHRLSLLVRNPSNLPQTLVQSPVVEVIEGTLEKETVLDRAASCGASIFVSFAGPSIGTKGAPLTLGYKALVPKLIDHDFKRILILCTPSYHDPLDTITFKWWLGACFMSLFSAGQYREMVGVGGYIASLSVDKTVQWTLFRVGGLTDAEEAPVKATFLGSGDDGTWISRQSVATWVLDEIDRERWLGKAPYICVPILNPVTAASDAKDAESNAMKLALLAATAPPEKPIVDPALASEASHSTLPTVPKGRMRELQLMHVWSMKTCHSFSSNLSGVFQSFVVEQAFHYPFLMDSLLALTALHIASGTSSHNDNKVNNNHGPLNSAIVSEYIDDALHYQNSAVPAFCATLENTSPSNCDALFACSVIMMAGAVVAPFIDSRRGNAIEKLTSPFHFIKGIHSVIDKSRPWLAQGPFQFAILTHSDDEWQSFQQDSEVFNRLRKLCFHKDPAIRNILDRAITLLGNCFAKGETMSIPWIVVVGEDFVDLVQQEEPMALLIYMYWGVLLSRLKDVWWATLAGRRIAGGLAKELARNNEWTRAIQWATEQVGIGKENLT